MGAEHAEERHSQSPQGEHPRRCPQDGHRRHPAEARRGARPLDVMDGDQLRQGPGLDRHRQALVAGDAGRSRRQHAGRRQQAAQRDPGAATRCCARSTRCGTPTRCARSCRWTGRRSPARSAPSGCARWPDPAPACARRPNSTPGSGRRRSTNWNEAGQRWWGLAEPAPADAKKGGDKRFAAPEWHENPVYRTLKEMYLLASDWLLEHGQVSRSLERGRAAAPQLPSPAVRRRHEPDPAAAVQPGGAAQGHGDGRSQPGRRGAEPADRPEGGPSLAWSIPRPSRRAATWP